MTYLEAVELLRKSEEKYDVMSIRYKGMSVWPYLRLYLLDSISDKTEIKASGTIIHIVLKSLFAYNPLKLFKKYDIWLFAGCERRKQIGDKMIHRVSGGISSCFGSECLMLEKPDIHFGHYRHNKIEEKNIVSEAWLLVLFHLLRVFLRPFKPVINNESIILQILSENGLTFNYRNYVQSLNAKRLALLWFMSITKRPKLAIMECPYDSMGYMWAFHQKGIKVIEMQHGVAGSSHNAYNAKAYEGRMNPDGICVFGSEEFRYFTMEKPQYTEKVYRTGLYMLEKADEYFHDDVFEDYRKEYKKVIVCSGQNGYEKELSSFVDKVALDLKNVLFVYIPRHVDAKLHFTANNVCIARNVNIYQYLKWTDLHITISSTTCLEAQYFCKPTIFYDYLHRASVYYGKLLTPDNGAFYIEDSSEFNTAFLNCTEGSFIYKDIFYHHHVERISKVIRALLNDE